jgi:hypothetical protein
MDVYRRPWTSQKNQKFPKKNAKKGVNLMEIQRAYPPMDAYGRVW